MHPWFKKPNKKQEAELAIKVILAKLKAGKYKNAQYETSDRRMLELYLKRIS